MSQDWSYRRGFEVAVRLRQRGKSLLEATDILQGQFPDLYERHELVRGFKHGFRHWSQLQAAAPSGGMPTTIPS